MVREIHSMSEDDKRQEGDAEKLAEKSKRMVSNVKKCSRMLCELAQDVDDKHRDCEVAKTVGLGCSVLGGMLSIAGGIATVSTAEAATPLLLAGVSFGVAGASTIVGTSIVQDRISSTAIEKAENYLGQTIESTSDVQSFVQNMLMKKDEVKRTYMYCFAKQQFGVSIPGQQLAVKILYRLLQSSKPILPAAVKVLGNVVKEGVTQIDDMFKAGAKVASLGKVVIVVNGIFVLWDVTNLGFTIRDLIKNKGSYAAKILRQKAEELENAID